MNSKSLPICLDEWIAKLIGGFTTIKFLSSLVQIYSIISDMTVRYYYNSNNVVNSPNLSLFCFNRVDCNIVWLSVNCYVFSDIPGTSEKLAWIGNKILQCRMSHSFGAWLILVFSIWDKLWWPYLTKRGSLKWIVELIKS